MRRFLFLIPLAACLWAFAEPLGAFCGFYVARADTTIFNQASEVVLVRDGDRTVLTMANDFKGDPREFAVVIPVPTFITRDQIHIAEKSLVDHVDAYTAPRLVEYFDENPCRVYEMSQNMAMPMAAGRAVDAVNARAKALGVTIEAQYTVGEYDIVILSAAQSSGLETWLTSNGYRMPAGAGAVLGSYIKQNMRFFVAKVNVKAQSRLGYAYLRPLQVAYESPKFMLPIRLGTVNSSGTQELFIYALTRSGRVETTNYRTVKLPSGMELPASTKERFAPFYRAMFDQQVRSEDMRAVFLEYAWDMGWCDPCAADPMSDDELRTLGVFWLDPGSSRSSRPPNVGPAYARPTGSRDVFVTRLHLRYDGAHFPEDLVFQQTGNRENFQGRYVLRHDWNGGETCPAAEEYRRSLPGRHEREAQTLASLTGWNIEDIRKQAGLPAAAEEVAWWRRIWK
jgi:hypothetical protein